MKYPNQVEAFQTRVDCALGPAGLGSELFVSWCIEICLGSKERSRKLGFADHLHRRKPEEVQKALGRWEKEERSQRLSCGNTDEEKSGNEDIDSVKREETAALLPPYGGFSSGHK
ncbi:hypothetical protein PM082_003305 [Marasmius tenuissimus]|nr:hypothetical protein PM082_003305 [Marasmius tenuissimus]